MKIDVDSFDPATGTRTRSQRVVGTYRTKREAEQEERKALEERDRGTLLAPDTSMVADVLDRYLTIEVPKTVAAENRQEIEIICNKHIRPAVGAIRVRRLTVESVEAMLSGMRNAGYSTTTIKRAYRRLNAALNMAVRWGIVGRNVCADVTPPKLSHKPAMVWTPEEARVFLDTAKGDTLAALWRLLVETGMRTSEVLGLMWADLDMDRATLRIGNHVVRLTRGTPILKTGGKTASAARTVTLTGEAVSLLRARRKTQAAQRLKAETWEDERLIFTSDTGRPLNARNVRRSFDRLVGKAGVPAITMHEIRKTRITTLIGAGANPKGVAAAVGHRDPAITLRAYTSLTALMQDDISAITAVLLGEGEAVRDA